MSPTADTATGPTPEDRPNALPEALSREVERVTILREKYRRFQARIGEAANCGPAIALMTASIEHAHHTIGRADLPGQIAAYNDLRGFTK